MNAKTVVSKVTTRSAATVNSGKVLSSSLLVLLIVMATAACGRTSSQTLAGQRTRANQTTCVRVGQDACYLAAPVGQHSSAQQQICVRVGHDACYQLIANK